MSVTFTVSGSASRSASIGTIAAPNPPATIPSTLGNSRQPAHALGFEAPTLEIRGYAGNAARLRNILKFNWEMVSTATGEVAGVGLEVLVLDERGRITTDYQFVEG